MRRTRFRSATTGRWPGQRMDFDEYIAHCRAVHAEPYVVVGYTTEKQAGRTEAQWIESAAAWVRYANVKKKYGVRYWEVGNENWNNGKGTPQEMAGIVSRFSRAMKAVDPTIKIGASGNGNEHWWAAFLPTAAPRWTSSASASTTAGTGRAMTTLSSTRTRTPSGDVETALNAIDRDAPPADRATPARSSSRRPTPRTIPPAAGPARTRWGTRW